MSHTQTIITSMDDKHHIPGFEDLFDDSEHEEAASVFDKMPADDNVSTSLQPLPKPKIKHVLLGIMVNGRQDYMLRYDDMDSALQAEYEFSSSYENFSSGVIRVGPDDQGASVTIRDVASIVGWCLVPVK